MSLPFFSVLPGHDLAYNEIVKPSRRWAFSYYFLYRWLPALHPQQAMLVQVLRQCTWQNGKPTGRCQLANATLCRLMGWSESSHKTLLVELERPLSEWFVRRDRTRKRHVTQGHAVEGAPTYRITMDDPLTPRDQAALTAYLATLHPTSVYAAAELLADLSQRRTRDLWALLDEQPIPDSLPAQPATVLQLARVAWPHLSATEVQASRVLAETAEQCHLRLTGAGYAHMELDYLLRGWLPELGVNNTWLTIVLRARCFHDPQSGETRDTVTLSRQALETQLGIPERTFRRLLRDEATHPLFHIAPPGESPDPAMPRNLPQRGLLYFKVAFPLLPVCPQDQERYTILLLGKAATDEAPHLSTVGQPTQLKAANAPSRSPRVIHRAASNPAESGQPTLLVHQQAANAPLSGWPNNPSEIEWRGQPTHLEAANQPNIPEAVTTNKLLLDYPEQPNQPFGRGGQAERSTIAALLEPFRLKGLSHILENPTLTAAEVRGWIYRGQEEVAPEQMGGFLFRRLSANSEAARQDPLPPAYLLAGAVTDEESTQFEEWWLSESSQLSFSDSAQRARYGAWLKVIKQEAGDPDRPDFSPHACWRREMARGRLG